MEIPSRLKVILDSSSKDSPIKVIIFPCSILIKSVVIIGNSISDKNNLNDAPTVLYFFENILYSP